MRGWLRRRPNYFTCPVCKSNSWVLYKVSLDRHPSWFLKSKMIAIEGPWGTCATCKNHFDLGEQVPRLMDRPGGFPVEKAALLDAQVKYEMNKRGNT
jgi:uncharacterized protein YbaR (Trm112 family)